jgi:hypothetical protein
VHLGAGLAPVEQLAAGDAQHADIVLVGVGGGAAVAAVAAVGVIAVGAAALRAAADWDDGCMADPEARSGIWCRMADHLQVVMRCIGHVHCL